jgi:hypothetical protein
VKDDVELALVGFLSADPAVLELVQTPPRPPRIFPDFMPQGEDLDAGRRRLASLVYEVLSHAEGFALVLGPHSLPNALILLECRAGTRREAKLLRSRVLSSRGGNPENRQLNGFAGSLGQGYTVQMAKVENSYYEYEPPIAAELSGVHVAAVELRVWWNNL